MLSIRTIRSAALFLGILFLLPACSNSEKDTFIAQCIAKQKSKDVCECTYDLAKESLDDNQYELFAASFLEDRSRQAKAQASLGMLESASAIAKLAWLAANLDDACINQ